MNSKKKTKAIDTHTLKINLAQAGINESQHMAIVQLLCSPESDRAASAPKVTTYSKAKDSDQGVCIVIPNPDESMSRGYTSSIVTVDPFVNQIKDQTSAGNLKQKKKVKLGHS